MREESKIVVAIRSSFPVSITCEMCFNDKNLEESINDVLEVIGYHEEEYENFIGSQERVSNELEYLFTLKLNKDLEVSYHHLKVVDKIDKNTKLEYIVMTSHGYEDENITYEKLSFPFEKEGHFNKSSIILPDKLFFITISDCIEYYFNESDVENFEQLVTKESFVDESREYLDSRIIC